MGFLVCQSSEGREMDQKHLKVDSVFFFFPLGEDGILLTLGFTSDYQMVPVSINRLFNGIIKHMDCVNLLD